MIDWWGHAFEDLDDNVAILGAALQDKVAGFWSGSEDAPNTARVVEEIRAAEGHRAVDEEKIAKSSKGGLALIEEADKMTGQQVGEVVRDAAGKVGTALDLLTNPWVIGGAVALVGLVIVGPYVTPFLKKG